MPSIAAGSIKLPETHPLFRDVVFDIEEGRYYNHRTDIFLTDDDVAYYNLPNLAIRERRIQAAQKTTRPVPTLQSLAKETIAVQDACNLCGVAQSFALVMLDLGMFVKNTDERNKHPIARAWIEKLALLSGMDNGAASNRDWDEVFNLAADKD